MRASTQLTSDCRRVRLNLVLENPINLVWWQSWNLWLTFTHAALYHSSLNLSSDIASTGLAPYRLLVTAEYSLDLKYSILIKRRENKNQSFTYTSIIMKSYFHHFCSVRAAGWSDPSCKRWICFFILLIFCDDQQRNYKRTS